MPWTLSDSIDDYLAVAGDFLRARPTWHTIELAAVATLLARGPRVFGSEAPHYGWWRSAGGDILGSAFHSPPYPMLISAWPEADLGALASDLAARGRRLAGVNGTADEAMSFAAAWSELTGVSSAVHRRSRLFQLGRLSGPTPAPPGAARVATSADSVLLGEWLTDFGKEVNDLSASAASDIADQLSYGGLTFWEVDGTPVALGGFHRPGAGVVRVGPVFTPLDHRRRGYGGAVTVAVSQAALDAGAAAVVLFTDLASQASNSLYPQLGYEPVTDRIVLAFGSPDQ
jgi:hypothetical protein